MRGAKDLGLQQALVIFAPGRRVPDDPAAHAIFGLAAGLIHQHGAMATLNRARRRRILADAARIDPPRLGFFWAMIRMVLAFGGRVIDGKGKSAAKISASPATVSADTREVICQSVG